MAGEIRKAGTSVMLAGGIDKQSDPAAHEMIQPADQLMGLADAALCAIHILFIFESSLAQ